MQCVPPQKGLESSSQIKFFFSGWQAAHRIGIVGFPNGRPSTERSRKFFSNKVFLLGVAGSTQNRHSRLPKWASLHSQIKFFFLGWQAAHRIGIVGVPMRVPPSRHSSARPSAPPPQKGLESSSQIKFFFLGWQAAHRIGIVGFPNGRPSTERSRKFFSK